MQAPPTWVERSRCAVGPCPGRAVFPASRSKGGYSPAFEHLSPNLATPWSLAQHDPADRRSDRRLPWSFALFSTCEPCGSTDRGRCLPAVRRPQGFLTLSAVSSPRDRAGDYFTPAALMRFCLRSFLRSARRRRVSAATDPLAVSPSGSPPPEGGRPARKAAASGFYPRGTSLAKRRIFHQAPRRMLPWRWPSDGLPPRACRGISPANPLSRLRSLQSIEPQ